MWKDRYSLKRKYAELRDYNYYFFFPFPIWKGRLGRKQLGQCHLGVKRDEWRLSSSASMGSYTTNRQISISSPDCNIFHCTFFCTIQQSVSEYQILAISTGVL